MGRRGGGGEETSSFLGASAFPPSTSISTWEAGGKRKAMGTPSSQEAAIRPLVECTEVVFFFLLLFFSCGGGGGRDGGKRGVAGTAMGAAA